MTRVLVLDAYAKAFVNFRKDFISDLRREGLEVHAAAPDFNPDIEAQLFALGVSSHCTRLARTGMNPLEDLRSIAAMARFMRRLRPDVVILYTPKGVVYGAIAATFAGVRRRYAMITGLGYGFVAGGWRGRLVSAIQHLLYRIALPRCDAVLFQNPDDRALFLRKGFVENARTGIVNGSGVDVAWFAPVPLPANPAFLLVGRLLVSKGVREFLQAAATVHSRYPGARFLLVGWLDESNRDSLGREELDRLLASGHVEYLGRLQDVRPAIEQCSVFVLPSYREGTPRSVLEAMSMGRAVITTDAPGCRETVVPGRNGFLVPVGSSVDLAEAMARFIECPELASEMGREARRLAVEKYDVRKVNEDIRNQLGLSEGAPA